MTNDEFSAEEADTGYLAGPRSKSEEELAREELLAAVKREGFEAGSFEDAWGRIMGVQAEIALNASMGSKATTAAKFLREVYGKGSGNDQEEEGGLKTAGLEATHRLLDLIKVEKVKRGEQPGE
ncbi:MAG: hypothetical protein OEV06_04930 [Anaerolineae bacterium]|nr:hypothetical protein [Anaerolineae bacterium]